MINFLKQLKGYPTFLNFVWYQSLWMTAVLGGTQAYPLLCFLFIAHFLLCEQRQTELMLMCCGALIGCSFDSVWSVLGLFSYTQHEHWAPIPLWHIAIWIGFCGTLRHALSFMTERPKLMIPVATFVAPLSYFSAMRLDAVSFPMGVEVTLVCVGLSWACALSLILQVQRTIQSRVTS